MPNLKEHVVISALTTGVTYFGMCRYFGRQPDLREFLFCEAVGIAAGAAPDVFEPAIDPNHRSLGHSLAVGAGLLKFVNAKCSRENGDWEEFLKIVAAVGAVSYLAHLVADGFTPKGLPLLGR